MATIDEAVEWLLKQDVVTVLDVFAAAERAGVSTKTMTEFLHERKILSESAVDHVKKYAGNTYERVYSSERH